MRETFAIVDAAPEPPLPPEFTTEVLRRGRRSAWIGKASAVAASVLAVIVAAVLIVPSWVHTPMNAAAPGDKPQLPRDLAEYSILTRSVTDHPIGRAAMIYVLGSGETINQFQLMVVDGNRYRQIETEFSMETTHLLAPDGRSVALADGQTLSLLDLGRGATTRTLKAVEPVLLAYSPDGRFLGYAENGALTIMDVHSGAMTRLGEITNPSDLAFHPDGKHLAVQLRDGDAWLYTVDGKRVRRIAPEGYRIVPRVAWSPDGRLIALQRVDDDLLTTLIHDAVDGGRVGSLPIPQMLGWRDNNTVLGMLHSNGSTGNVLHSFPARGFDNQPGESVYFPSGHSCEYWSQPCMAIDVQLATALLPDLTIVDSGEPERGPWPPWIFLLLIPVALLVWWPLRKACVSFLFWQRRRR